MGIWDENFNIGSSSRGPPDGFTVGSVDMWGAAGSGLTVSRGAREGTVSGQRREWPSSFSWWVATQCHGLA